MLSLAKRTMRTMTSGVSPTGARRSPGALQSLGYYLNGALPAEILIRITDGRGLPAYAYYNHPDQLTRESIIEYFGTRENWAKKQAIWLEAYKEYTEGVSRRISGAKRSQEYCRRELEYRRQFVGLLNNEAYDAEWRMWEMYIEKIDELYRKGGTMQRFQVEMRVMEGKYKEAGELYEFFWDLEDHRGLCISVVRSHNL